MDYGLYPWVWDPVFRLHRMPTGASRCIDLRTIQDQNTAGQSAGFGFFVWESSPPPADLISLGSGDCREIRVATRQRQDIRKKLQLPKAPDGDFLVDVLSDVLGPLSDPTGQNAPKPLMPNIYGNLEIHLGMRDCAWSRSYNPAATLASSSSGHADRVKCVLRSQLEQAFDDGGKELTSKVLGGLLLRHGYRRSEVAVGAPDRCAEWQRLVSGELLEKLGPGTFAPRLPATTYTVNFDDNSLSGWTELNSFFSFSASSARSNFTGGDTVLAVLRYDSDVSSADHKSTMTLLSGAAAYAGSIARKDSTSSGPFYLQRNSSASHWEICKVSSSYVPTQIATDSSSVSLSDTTSIQCSGSTISIPEKSLSVTDTTVTTGTRGGLTAIGDSFTGSCAQDNWSIMDLTTAASDNRPRGGRIPAAFFCM